jgi:hypothetical protein
MDPSTSHVSSNLKHSNPDRLFINTSTDRNVSLLLSCFHLCTPTLLVIIASHFVSYWCSGCPTRWMDG